MRRSTLLELSGMELHEVAHVRRCFAGELAHGDLGRETHAADHPQAPSPNRATVTDAHQGPVRPAHTTPPLFDQPHSLKLELACKLPSLHDTPPVPSKHLTRCPRNRVQASLGQSTERLFSVFCHPLRAFHLPRLALTASATAHQSSSRPRQRIRCKHSS